MKSRIGGFGTISIPNKQTFSRWQKLLFKNLECQNLSFSPLKLEWFKLFLLVRIPSLSAWIGKRFIDLFIRQDSPSLGLLSADLEHILPFRKVSTFGWILSFGLLTSASDLLPVCEGIPPEAHQEPEPSPRVSLLPFTSLLFRDRTKSELLAAAESLLSQTDTNLSGVPQTRHVIMMSKWRRGIERRKPKPTETLCHSLINDVFSLFLCVSPPLSSELLALGSVLFISLLTATASSAFKLHQRGGRWGWLTALASNEAADKNITSIY